MRHTTSVRRVFEASHSVAGHSRCGWQHGHRWAISITVGGGLDPKKILVVDHGNLEYALDRVVDEFADRDLNDMVPGVVTTPEGLGLYILERLTLDFPTIQAVTVEMGERVVIRVGVETR